MQFMTAYVEVGFRSVAIKLQFVNHVGVQKIFVGTCQNRSM